MTRLKNGSENRKLCRERKTVKVMIGIYCRDNHEPADGLCDECDSLMSYTETRLAACPFGEGKPPCTDCPVHCYEPVRRELIRAVMRYAGPRMTFRHPVLAMHHLLGKRKKQRN